MKKKIICDVPDSLKDSSNNLAKMISKMATNQAICSITIKTPLPEYANHARHTATKEGYYSAINFIVYEMDSVKKQIDMLHKETDVIVNEFNDIMKADLSKHPSWMEAACNKHIQKAELRKKEIMENKILLEKYFYDLEDMCPECNLDVSGTENELFLQVSPLMIMAIDSKKIRKIIREKVSLFIEENKHEDEIFNMYQNFCRSINKEIKYEKRFSFDDILDNMEKNYEKYKIQEKSGRYCFEETNYYRMEEYVEKKNRNFFDFS